MSCELSKISGNVKRSEGKRWGKQDNNMQRQLSGSCARHMTQGQRKRRDIVPGFVLMILQSNGSRSGFLNAAAPPTFVRPLGESPASSSQTPVKAPATAAYM